MSHKIKIVKSKLVKHQATHREVRSFKCYICSRGMYFKIKHDLNFRIIYHYKPKFSSSHRVNKIHISSYLKKHE